MYKTPELSKMAKTLRAELATKGLDVSHAQAMELVAKTTGHRTLHVAQAEAARPAKGVNLEEFAIREAARQMFQRLGRFEGRVLELVQGIREAYAHEDSRDTEQAISQLFEQGHHAVLSAEMEPYRHDELPAIFDRKVAEVKRLAFEFSRGAVVTEEHREVLWRGEMLDWQLEEDPQCAELTERQRRGFQAEITRRGSQLVMDISLPHTTPDEHAGTDSLSLFIEINKGMPCVHLSNDMYGDQVLTVFGTAEGLYLRPESFEDTIRDGLPANDGVLKELMLEDRGELRANAWFPQSHIAASNGD